MPLNFAVYQKILADLYQYISDYFISVTISDTRGQLVGNFQLLINALTFFNSSVLKRSSETLCESLKNFSQAHPSVPRIPALNIHKPKHIKPKSDEQFGYYLAGLIEGNGHFSNQNQLIIYFHVQDIKLAYYLKSRQGYGTVKKIKDKQAINYILSNKEGILKVIGLINGKIRTPIKYNQIITNHPGSLRGPLNKLPLDNTSFSNNYWLAGFCDADASFQVKIIHRQKNQPGVKINPQPLLRPSLPEIRLSLQIDQKTSFILDKILEEFGGNIGYRKKLDTYNYSSVSYSVAHKFISYFRIFHLLSYKYVNYLKWCKVYSYIQIKEHLTPQGVKKIIQQKESMRKAKALPTDLGDSPIK